MFSKLYFEKIFDLYVLEDFNKVTTIPRIKTIQFKLKKLFFQECFTW